MSIDFETASTQDLRRTGAHAYAMHPDTMVLCLSYGFPGEPVQNWRPGQPFPHRLKQHVERLRRVQGWNVTFEWLIWNHVLARYVPDLPLLDPSQLSDTMARAAYWGLPLSLEQAGFALGLGVVKDAAGHRLMMQMNKPRSYGKDGRPVWWHETDPDKYDRLVAYCDRDVESEAAIAACLPPLPDSEQAYWEMDLRINQRGVALDTVLIDKLKALAATAKADANATIEFLTGGAVATATNTKALLSYLQSKGSPLTDLTKDRVKRRLESPDVPDHEREILETRQDAAKTSTSKLNAFLSAASGGRVRGMLQFYGAFRTGRWAGRLVQLQNLPRGTIKKIGEAIEAVLHDMPADLLGAFFGPPLAIVSSALRGCIVAGPGALLMVADFSQIEARVVAWLAGQTDILDVFKAHDNGTGPDVYVYTAKKNGSSDRQLGKVLVLACGFGMSWSKFKETAASYGLTLTDEQAEEAVKTWRKANAKIVQFWWDCDEAARAVLRRAAEGNSETVKVGPVEFGMWRGHLLVRLPSGRRLVYRDAELRTEDGREVITYMGVDQYTRKWTRLRTYGGKIVENITQATARDIMAEATFTMERAHGIAVELLVHDEVIAEAPAAEAKALLDIMLQVMRTPPAWAPDLPVNGEGWVGPRYKK